MLVRTQGGNGQTPVRRTARPRRITVEKHQSVLDQRQLVLAVAGIGDQALGQFQRDFALIEQRRLANRAYEIGVSHRREEILSLVYRLCEPGILGAGTKELGTHGHDEIEAGRWPLSETYQDGYEQPHLVRTMPAREREEFLELIHQNAQMIVGTPPQQVRKRLWGIESEV